MKNKKLRTAALIFFLVVNSTYYWEGKLGLFAFPAFFILVLVYLALCFALIREIYFSVKAKFEDKTQLLDIVLLTTVLTLTFLKPIGLIDFDNLEGDNLLIAEREGAANCLTILKLKDDFTFNVRSYCFGVTETKGKYHVQNDTIYFDNVNLGRDKSGFYQYAIIEPVKFKVSGKHFYLVCFENSTDTVGLSLPITKNELNKLKKEKIRR